MKDNSNLLVIIIMQVNNSLTNLISNLMKSINLMKFKWYQNNIFNNQQYQTGLKSKTQIDNYIYNHFYALPMYKLINNNKSNKVKE